MTLSVPNACLQSVWQASIPMYKVLSHMICRKASAISRDELAQKCLYSTYSVGRATCAGRIFSHPFFGLKLETAGLLRRFWE